MTITNIKIRETFKVGKLKAIASVTFDDQLAVHDIKIIQGYDRTFVAMPSRTSNEGKFIDTVHPINSEFRNYVEGEVLRKYHEYVEREVVTVESENVEGEA